MRVYTFLKILLVVAVFFGCALLFFEWKVGSPRAPQGAPVNIVIDEGKSVDAIARQLVAEGIINSARWLKVYVWVHRKSNALQAGQHDLQQQSSIKDVVRRLVGDEVGVVNEVRVIIPEGLTSGAMLEIFRDQGMTAKNFEDAVASTYITNLPEIFFAGRPRDTSWEGYLFPDTYNFYTNAEGEEIVEKMVRNFATQLEDERHAAIQAQASDLNFYEIITLASIIEKELKTPEERRIGAGIFLRRLNDHYPLESDATINFITGKRTTQPSNKDLGVDSQYNTYKYIGLPPGPIANPGLDAIDAVLRPTQTDYYFFLTTPEPEGRAIFSKTFDEHLQNKAQYYP